MPRISYPAIEQEAAAHGIDILFWHIQERETELQQLVGSCEAEASDTEQIRSTARRIEKWAERVLLAFWYGPDAKPAHRHNGAPYVEGTAEVISISHTGRHLAIARSVAGVGIDIEQRSPRALRLASRFLDEREMAWAIDQDKPEDAATLLWSAKEAAFKCAQIDHLSLLADIHIHPTRLGAQWTVDVQEPGRDVPHRYRLWAAVMPAFTFAMCW